MADNRQILLTGATGTVGRHLLSALLGDPHVTVLTVGRRHPDGLAAPHRHIPVDFADVASVNHACRKIAEAVNDQLDSIVFAAGIDCRQSIVDIDPIAFFRAMQVNCLAQLQILRQVLSDSPARRTLLRIVAVSSDVVQRPTVRSVVYGATKAAFEEALRQATSDACIRVILARLPNIGISMRETAESSTTHRVAPVGVSWLVDSFTTQVMNYLGKGGKADRSPVEVWSWT